MEKLAINKYSKLFEPLKIGEVEIKNRIAMAPMGAFGLVTLQGAFSSRAVDYYVERAKGGTGLIITSLVKVENEIEKTPNSFIPCLSLDPVHFIQTASEMIERVHSYGARIFIQLTGGLGRVGPPHGLLSHPVAPSPIPNYWDPDVTCREMTIEEIERLISAFGEAARTAVSAGFDGIEIHAVHEGYLIDQFAIAMFNHRADKYGGDLRARLTLPIDIVKKIKKEVGKDFPVQLRYSIKSYIKDWGQGGLPGEEFREAGRDIPEGLEAARILEEAGYDAFNADAGSYDAFYWAHPPLYQVHGCYLPLTQKLKEVVKVPVIVAGRMEIPDLALSAITEGQADMIALGRGLLAEPYWPNKVLEGRIAKIRPCLGCHDGCAERGVMLRPLSCAVNPSCGRERDYSLRLAEQKRKVMVIGGGVAGMEAARVAALRGHKVIIFEKSNQLGGHLVEASVPDFKKDVAMLLQWYKDELAESGVEIHLNQEVSPDLVLKDKSMVCVVATGSKWAIPDIQNIEDKKVLSTTDLLLGKVKAEEQVAVIGGGLVGCETALWLVKQGKSVTIVEILDDVIKSGMPVAKMNRMMLIDLLKFHNVKILTNTVPLEVTTTGVKLKNQNQCQSLLSAGTVIIAAGLKPDNKLFKSIGGKLPDSYLIGDARQPRNIMYAIWEAYEVARNI